MCSRRLSCVFFECELRRYAAGDRRCSPHADVTRRPAHRPPSIWLRQRCALRDTCEPLGAHVAGRFHLKRCPRARTTRATKPLDLSAQTAPPGFLSRGQSVPLARATRAWRARSTSRQRAGRRVVPAVHTGSRHPSTCQGRRCDVSTSTRPQNVMIPRVGRSHVQSIDAGFALTARRRRIVCTTPRAHVRLDPLIYFHLFR